MKNVIKVQVNYS